MHTHFPGCPLSEPSVRTIKGTFRTNRHLGQLIKFTQPYQEEMVQGNLIIRNTFLPYQNPAKATVLYHVICKSGLIHAVVEADERFLTDSESQEVVELDAEGRGLLLPSLCHAHIHLDKCFLLDKCDRLVTGDFPEALAVTAKAKSRLLVELDDLYQRGKRLVLDSVEAGVTCMRAHVEVDTTVYQHCLQTGLRLKKELSHLCDIQITAFAQDPLFPSSPTTADSDNIEQLRLGASTSSVEAVGSAPYVERTRERAEQNIRTVLDLAYEHGLHADFHLDYNMDPLEEPLIWYLLDQVKERVREERWILGRCVCVGHATRLTLFSDREWTKFKAIVQMEQLPIMLVGLPQSDLYMMGRDLHPVPRGTLDIIKLSQKPGIKVAMAVNNVNNAFTPQGPPDPLALCSLGVAVFQAATPAAAHILVEAVTTVARQATGKAPSSSFATNETLVPRPGDPADFVLLHGNMSMQSVVCNPVQDRTTVKAGRIIAQRTVKKWFAE